MKRNELRCRYLWWVSATSQTARKHWDKRRKCLKTDSTSQPIDLRRIFFPFCIILKPLTLYTAITTPETTLIYSIGNNFPSSDVTLCNYYTIFNFRHRCTASSGHSVCCCGNWCHEELHHTRMYRTGTSVITFKLADGCISRKRARRMCKWTRPSF